MSDQVHVSRKHRDVESAAPILCDAGRVESRAVAPHEPQLVMLPLHVAVAIATSAAAMVVARSCLRARAPKSCWPRKRHSWQGELGVRWGGDVPAPVRAAAGLRAGPLLTPDRLHPWFGLLGCWVAGSLPRRKPDYQ